jgi:hypothetical protein
MGFHPSFGWLGQPFARGRSVVVRFLFTLALEDPSGGQQSFESGRVEGGALIHAEFASIDGWSSSKNGNGIGFTLPRENILVELPTSAIF